MHSLHPKNPLSLSLALRTLAIVGTFGSFGPIPSVFAGAGPLGDANANASGDARDEKVEVDQIRERYWAQGNESELGVVQNRTFSKKGRFHLAVIGGVLTSDPFLNITQGGLHVGYYLTETWGLHLLGWKSWATGSAALLTFQDRMGATTNYNAPLGYLGGEVSASILYGKLSLLGAAILHFDLHTLAGLGSTSTENGHFLTPSLGIGQQIHLSRNFSLRADYRVMSYNETIVEKVVPQLLGQKVGERLNWTHAITFGVSFQFGHSSEKTGGNQK